MSTLATKPDNGLAVAISVLNMVIHCADNKSEEYISELQAYCSKFVGEIDWESLDLNNDNLTHDLEEIIESSFSAAAQPGEAVDALNRLIHFERAKAKIIPRRLGSILMPFFKRCPEEALNACYFQDGNGDYSSALRLVSVKLDELADTALCAVPEEVLINWCNLSPEDRYDFAAQTCKLLEKSNADGFGDESVMSISSTAKTVLAHAPDKKIVLEIFLDRYQPTHWSGSRSLILRQRLQLLDQLNLDNNKELQTLIEDAKIYFSKIIASEEQREQDGERASVGFE